MATQHSSFLLLEYTLVSKTKLKKLPICVYMHAYKCLIQNTDWLSRYYLYKKKQFWSWSENSPAYVALTSSLFQFCCANCAGNMSTWDKKSVGESLCTNCAYGHLWHSDSLQKKVILVSFLTRIISYLVTYQPKKIFLKRQFLQQARPLLVPYQQVLVQGVDIPESQERLLHQAVDAQISLECLAIPMTHCSLPKLHRFKYLVTPKG